MPPHERHSTARRAQLKKSIPDIIVSQQYSIKKYYSLSESLLEMFMDSFEKSALNDAYIYGLRFIMIVTDVVPKHGYYNSSEFNSEKSRSRRMANTVLDQMEQIVDQMDIEEAERTLVLNARLLSEKKETARLVLQNEMREAKRREEMSAAEKYLPKEAPPAPVFEPSTTPAPVFTPSAPPPAFDDEGLFDEEKALPPPLPPPSYDVTVASATGAVSHASVSPPPPPPSASISPLFLTTATTVASTTLYPSLKRRTPTIPMHQMKSVYLSDWSDLLASKRASVYKLDTFQGRVVQRGANSTNGCTVIAPLVAAQHLVSQGGISDQSVEDVIDRVAGKWLIEIRGKLGLSENALIIPSDVHDHFVDNKVLSQELFIGASGGNILDEEHISGMLTNLDENGRNLSAAALFFHAHVVSIVKMVVGKETWYDLIDSLPMEHGKAGRGGARIRCKDVKTLGACIRWYASSKLGQGDMEFCDSNDWDDMNCDFDPRVFQGFVWGLPEGK